MYLQFEKLTENKGIPCSLAEELVRFSIEVSRQCSRLTFTFLRMLETVGELTIKIPLIRAKISSVSDLNSISITIIEL